MRMENQVGGLRVMESLVDHDWLLGVLSRFNEKSFIFMQKNATTSHSFGKDDTTVWVRLE